MSTIRKIEADALKYGPYALQAIGVALTLMGAGGEAATVLASAQAALESFAKAAAEGANPSAIIAEITKLVPSLAADDAAADAAVAAKFPETPPPPSEPTS